jgi:hypothetical protein
VLELGGKLVFRLVEAIHEIFSECVKHALNIILKSGGGAVGVGIKERLLEGTAGQQLRT